MERAFPLRLHWLGHPLVELDGKPVKFEMRKSLALLAYLCLEGREFSREGLAALFWPEFDQQHALANLRRSLSSLCDRIPGDTLSITRQGLAFIRGPHVWEDVTLFQQYLKSANQQDHLEGALHQSCLYYLEEAASLYQADFLEGFNLPDCPGFDEWQTQQCEYLREEFAHTLSRLVKQYVSTNQPQKALPFARRWAALDRLHEPAQLAMIELLCENGLRSEGLRQYENFARLLKEELDQQPSPEAHALYQKLCRKESDHQAQSNLPAFSRKDYREQIAGPVLKTKLYIPTLRPHHVSRSRLIDAMDDIPSNRLTLLSAPAGFGKTSLLAEWIARSAVDVCWFSLDSEDNYPGRFLAYLIASFQSVSERLGVEASPMLRMPDPPPVQTILTSLINDLSSLDAPIALVLDDYQQIHSQPIHEMITFILEHCPDVLHLVIATRVDPPLPVARLRSRGQLLEFRTNDLRFSLQEAGSFLNQRMGLDLSEIDIENVNDRAEGWAAGLQMAALSLKGQTNPAGFIEDFSGSQRFIMDYLIEEVFAHQPDGIKRFLLRTSVLERLSAPLCEAVNSEPSDLSPTTPAQEILEYLERSNLFLEPLDQERCWYRYHHLFAELLLNRLQQQSPDLLETLHRRAADWYETKGMLPQVIRHSLRGHDYERAARYVQQIAADLWEHGDYFLAFSWFELLPKEFIDHHPWLCMYRAWSLGVDGKSEQAETLLSSVEQANQANPDAADQRNLAGYVDYVHAVLADSRGDLAAMIRYDQDALSKLDEKNLLMRRGIAFQLGRAYHLVGDQETSQKIWEEIIQTDRRTGAGFASILSLCMLTWLKVAVGKLNEAEMLCQEAASWMDQVHEPHNSRTAGLVWIVFANVYFERNALELAERYVRQAIDCFERFGNLYALTMSYVILAGIRRRQGDAAAAWQSLEKADAIVQRRKIYADALAWLRGEKVNLWLAQNDLAAAQQYLIESHITPQDRVEFTTEIQYLALARVLMAQGSAEEAVQMLTGMAKRAAEEKRPGRRMKILTVLALAWQGLGKMDQAVSVLNEALVLAAPEGFAGILIDGGEPMEHLLQYGLQHSSREWRNSPVDSFISSFCGKLSSHPPRAPQ